MININGESTQYCRKCGTKLIKENKKYVTEVNDFFCTKCAKEIEDFYKANHTCAVCGRKFGKSEIKIAISNSILGNNSNPDKDFGLRFVGVECYNKLTTKNISKINNSNAKIDRIRKDIRKSIVNRQFKV
ncbi:MAG: hypothetical protein M1538_01425 [Candidatus Marsarchaeota archaeon]|nr:hypothetical protein [Candidatus Marsarchaeota archaeon]